MPALLDIVRPAAAELGFSLVGAVSAEAPESAELAYFPQWIEEGKAGEMAYLAKRNDEGEYRRRGLRAALPWANSAIMLAMNYNADAPRSTDPAATTQGWISRYAWSGADSHATDYHDVILTRLRSLEAKLIAAANAAGDGEVQSRCYVDTGPLVERVFAKYAGLGWIGKNTCLINQEIGSWFFLGAIVTSLPLADLIGPETTAPVPAPDRCGTCTRCIDACPTHAITALYQLDARRCIAYLTIEKRGTIPEEFRSAIGRHIFGCDICQDVCPWNRSAHTTVIPEFQPRSELVNPDLESFARLSRPEFNKLFRGSPIERTKYAGLRRNLAIAMGNSGEARYVPLLEELAADEDATVAEHARWALSQLAATAAQKY